MFQTGRLLQLRGSTDVCHGGHHNHKTSRIGCQYIQDKQVAAAPEKETQPKEILRLEKGQEEC